jgi:hypothetical protein
MKTPYIYHPEEMFLPSKSWEVNTILDGTVTIIDNFYLNPESVVELAGRLAFTNHPDFTSAAPLWRAIFFGGMKSVENKLLRSSLVDGGVIMPLHTFNIQTRGMILEHSLYRCPHLDSNTQNEVNEWSLLVYLTDDGVGTTFYENPSDTTACQTIISAPVFMEKWRETATVAGRYNRAILFPSSSCYHKIDAQNARKISKKWRLFQVSTIVKNLTSIPKLPS